ncbi:MAG: bifunctional riboflavin kinase/FAD synthetase [Candidatus Omnitrophica bacterium]|nr:bifunctional riboflavin kinase/FAD synthetase [Candidatus Omnitrophota bacterium]
MQVVFGFKKFKIRGYPLPRVVAIGTFDGVHKAHRRIIKTAVQKAKIFKGTSIVLTFSPHPAKVTRSSKLPDLITSIAHRLKLIGELGPDICIIVDFDKKFANISASDFVRGILKQKLGASFVVVGENFNFGKKKAGNVAYLKKRQRIFQIKPIVLPAYKKGVKTVSSSQIRNLIRTGKIKQAEAMLGRTFSIIGIVEKGARRGAVLGFATANIQAHQEVLPPGGVYAVRAKVGKKWYRAMLNIGYRPTFYKTNAQMAIEAHIFNFNRKIYGQTIEIQFISRIRKEKMFSNTQDLRKQLLLDKHKIKHIFRRVL